MERGRPHAAPPVKVDVAKWLELTTQSPPEAAVHGGAVLQLSPGTVRRHGQANDLKPHWVRGCSVSRDPKAAPNGRDADPSAHARHAHAEWLKFLRKIDRETPKDKALHLIADNCVTHQHPSAPGCTGLPGQQSRVRHAPHAHLGVAAEQGGAPLPRHHRRAAVPWRVHRRAGVGRHHRRAHRPPPHQTQAVQLGQERCRPPSEGHSRKQPTEFRTECNTTRGGAKDRPALPNGA